MILILFARYLGNEKDTLCPIACNKRTFLYVRMHYRRAGAQEADERARNEGSDQLWAPRRLGGRFARHADEQYAEAVLVASEFLGVVF